MKSPSFAFKKFVIQHDRSAMKVGTDGVLLGAWVTVGHAKRLLDIGTGSGVIAVMLAQRSDANVHIDAVEISEPDYMQATENAARSPWSAKIKIHHCAIQDFHPEVKYDLIVSNPPYFINSSSPPSPQRKRARHAEALGFDALVDCVVRLLSDTGKFALVLPVEEGNQFCVVAERSGLHCVRRMAFYSRKEKSQERWLMEFSFGADEMKTEVLILHGDGNAWSDAYRELMKGFYLYI